MAAVDIAGRLYYNCPHIGRREEIGVSERRICLYDNMRAWLICAVVVGHFADVYSWTDPLSRNVLLFIYGFHMAGFFFLAGLLYRREGTRTRVLGCLAVGFALKVALALHRVLLGWEPAFSLLGDMDAPWFMFVLAAYTALAWLTEGIDKRPLLVLAVAVGCFAGHDESLGDWLYLARLAVFWPFFLMGQLFDRQRLARTSRRPVLRLAGGAVLLAWAAVCALFGEEMTPLRYLFTGRNPFSAQALFLPWGCLWRLLCYAIAGACVLALVCVTPDRPLGPVTRWGRRTEQAYFWHLPVRDTLWIIPGLRGAIAAVPWGTTAWLLGAAALTALLSLRPFAFPAGMLLRRLSKKKEG